MTILLGLLAAIGVVVGLLIRMNMAANAARDVADVAKDAHGMARGWFWRRKFAKNPLEMIDDPREGVAAMLVAIAQENGALTDGELGRVADLLVHRFELQRPQADELIAHARWAIKEQTDASQTLRRVGQRLKQLCSEDQLRDVLAMLDVMAGEGDASKSVTHHAIRQLRHSWGV